MLASWQDKKQYEDVKSKMTITMRIMQLKMYETMESRWYRRRTTEEGLTIEVFCVAQLVVVVLLKDAIMLLSLEILPDGSRASRITGFPTKKKDQHPFPTEHATRSLSPYILGFEADWSGQQTQQHLVQVSLIE